MRLFRSRLIARENTMERLRAAGHDARLGRGGTVFVVGEAGVGKTRVVRELELFTDRAGLCRLRGRATSASPVAYRPLSEALFSVLRDADTAADAALVPYRPALSRLVPEWRLQRPSGADDSLVVLAEAVLRVVARLGHGRGCLLALEDLHDADPESLAVVEYLADNLDGQPVLLVGTVRPESSAALAMVRDLAARRVATVLELDRLDGGSVRALAAGCLGVAPAEVPEPVLDRLRSAGGLPFYVEELLAGMVGDGSLVHSGERWRLAGTAGPAVPDAVVHHTTARAARVGPAGLALLQAAAVIGQRFPGAVVAEVAGLAGPEFAAHLRAAIAAQLVTLDGSSDTYAFRHALIVDALRTTLLPTERAELSGRAARALERFAPDLPDGWCQLAAELWLAAGDTARAAELFGEAGRRATTRGAAVAAAGLFDRALRLVPAGRTELAGELAMALLEANLAAGDAAAAAGVVARIDACAETWRRAAAHLCLARAAADAGRWVEGLREVEVARGLGGAELSPAASAALDAVAARLAFGNPTADRVVAARRLAARALRTAMAAGLPEATCDALELLGTCARQRDLAAAERLYERALRVAEEHRLAPRRARLLFLLGGHDGVRFATMDRLALARATAQQTGAVVTTVNIDGELAVVHTTRAEYPAAQQAAVRCEEMARRLRLDEMRLVGLGLRICVAAHRGQRAEVDRLLTAFTDLGGRRTDFTAALWGFGLATCSLLEEDRARAHTELSRAVADEAGRPPHYLSLSRGAHLLLAVLAGKADWPAYHALAASAHGQAAWNHRFIVLARAVLHGREGRARLAAEAVAQAAAMPAHQPLALHLGLRLVAEAAVEDGWGEPAQWLRTAEEYFHETGAVSVAAACRALLRRAGAPVRQRRRGSTRIPPWLRAHGVTVREYEVLTLVVERLSNRAIGQRLYLSTRTVEKHVANLLAKTGQPDRAALARYTEGAGSRRTDRDAS